MSTFTQIPPRTIKGIVKLRISSTNELWANYKDSLNYEKNIYFNYYFDFSTAIETCLHCIILELKKNKELGALVSLLLQADSDSRSFFLDGDYVKKIIDEIEYNKVFNFDEYEKKFLTLVKPKISKKLPESSYSYTLFINKYKEVRDDRNRLAHGLKSFDGVNLTTDRLRDFIYVFYVIFAYYSHIHKKG